jgi:hypothetical protein
LTLLPSVETFEFPSTSTPAIPGGNDSLGSMITVRLAYLGVGDIVSLYLKDDVGSMKCQYPYPFCCLAK